VKRDLQARYAGSLLGAAWSFAQPIWLLLLFTFVFSTVMRVQPLGSAAGSFGVFLLAGLLPWLAVQEGVLRASTAITDNAALVKKLRFPSEILVLAVVAAAVVHEGIAVALFLVVLGVTGDLAPAGLPLLLLALPLQLILTVALGLLLAPLHVFVRDTAQVLSMLLTGWFYLTPIVYPLGAVPERLRVWIELNPLTALVGLYRQAFLGDAPPHWEALAGLGVGGTLLLLAGGMLFRRLKPAFVDEI